MPNIGGNNILPAVRQNTRGLSTVALLKVFFDEHKDHIGMFMPFVVHVINSHPTDDFALTDVKSVLLARHGLDVPTPAYRHSLVEQYAPASSGGLAGGIFAIVRTQMSTTSPQKKSTSNENMQR